MYASFITSRDIANPIMTAMNGRHVFIRYTDLRLIISSGPIDYKKSTSGKRSTRHYRTKAELHALTPICSMYFPNALFGYPSGLVHLIQTRTCCCEANNDMRITLHRQKLFTILQLFQTECLCCFNYNCFT